MLGFEELYQALITGDETVQIEAKRSEKVGQAAMDTICAFSNEPGIGGGYLLLGIQKRQSPAGPLYEIVGVDDPDKLQNDLASQCRTVFNVPVRPEIAVHVRPDNKKVVVVRVPEVQPNEKPVYFRKLQLPRGAFRRIGSSDHQCTDHDIAHLFGLRGEIAYDETVVDGASIADLDVQAIRAYRRARRELNQSAQELRLGNVALLKSIGAAVDRDKDTLVTRAGLLLFGKTAALRRFCPSARIDYILVPGQDWVPDPTERYRTVEIRQALLLAVPRVIDLIIQDLPKSFKLKGRRTRRDEIPAIPFAVIREAIVNAVMHRTYREHEPIQVIKFSDRLEIRNAGYSLIATERLGEPGSQTRNPTIAAVLHETGYAETKGTGIRVMREQMHNANLTEPIFKSNRDLDLFEVTLLTHHLLDADTVNWLSQFAPLNLTQEDAKALVFVRKRGYIDNATYRAINGTDVLAASFALRRLRDIGLLRSHGKSTATYYTASEALNPPDKRPLLRGLSPPDKGAVQPRLSPELVGLLRRVGERSDPVLIEIAIIRLCAHAPMTSNQLARFVGRGAEYLRHRFITRMVKSGVIQYVYPDTPAHPRQAYVAAPWMAEVSIPPDSRQKTKQDDRSRREPKLF